MTKYTNYLKDVVNNKSKIGDIGTINYWGMQFSGDQQDAQEAQGLLEFRPLYRN